jgi:hypothetical protein
MNGSFRRRAVGFEKKTDSRRLQRLELNQPIKKDFLVGGFQPFIELLIRNKKTHISNNHQSEYEGLDARPVEALNRYKLVLTR